MTSRGFWDQGEGSDDAEHRPYRGTPQRWSRQCLVPAACLRIELSLHTGAPDGSACLGFEVRDPHTKELLALWLDPATIIGERRGLVGVLLDELRLVLLDLVDPDPF